jgi:hypothetical protein
MRAIALARPTPMRSIYLSCRFIRPMPARIFLSVSRVIEIDSKVETRNALVIAEVEMMVLSPFTAAHVGVARPGKNGDLKREE